MLSVEAVDELLEELRRRGWTELDIDKRVRPFVDVPGPAAADHPPEVDSSVAASGGPNEPSLNDDQPFDTPDVVTSEATEEEEPRQVAAPSTQASVRGHLIDALSDTDDSVRFTAICGLGDHLDASLVPILEPLLDDPDSYVRDKALSHYRELRPPDVQKRLVDALSDTDDSVRFTAICGLGDHLDASLVPILEPLLHDPDSYVRDKALELVREIGRPHR